MRACHHNLAYWLNADYLACGAGAHGHIFPRRYFDVLGIRFLFGRGFTPDDDRIGAPVRVAVISHALWQRAFNGDRSLIGQTIRLNGNAYTLVGAAPPGFAGPVVGVATDVWVPTALQPEVDPPSAAVRRARGHSAIFDLRRSRGLNMVARLPRGASIGDVVAFPTSTAEVVSLVPMTSPSSSGRPPAGGMRRST